MISRRLFVLGAAALPIVAKAEVMEGIVSAPAITYGEMLPGVTYRVAFTILGTGVGSAEVRAINEAAKGE